MLAYLESLCQALSARDEDRIRCQLQHPLARVLPRGVRAEALAIARAGHEGRMAPVRTLHFYYQTIQLLASQSEPDPMDAMLLHAAQPLRPELTALAVTQ
ncbi:MAG TPA: hypothetical protein VFK16_07425 [Gemmatimonadaceae bacterium]|jgi:hypothetical protein|nr:hypothetical protein [Gemmatimonadaceae bacterium]